MDKRKEGFHEISLADQGWMKQKLAEDDRNACEYTFANNFIWRKKYGVAVAEIQGCAVIRFCEQGRTVYSYPVGNGDKKAAIEELFSLSRAEGEKLKLSPLSEKDREELLEWFPGQFLIYGDRDNYDYIYAREKLATLAGKKLHGKRNHIARFQDAGDWCYEELTPDNLEECRAMTYTWIKMREEKWNEEMEEEMLVLHEAFDHMAELGLTGGLIRKNGQIVAFTLGEPLNSDTFVVHFEKAFPDLQGAYPMINQQFVLHACEGYAYINREEDTGDPGLRKAKLSYYPEILLKKYAAEESSVVFADKEKDSELIRHIWRTCFGDDDDLIHFYLGHRMTDENMLVIREDGKIVSMASFLPVSYEREGQQVPAQYVYAVATLPEYRKRGYAAGILKKGQELFGMPLFLIPASLTLEEYYGRLGFRFAFEQKTFAFDQKSIRSKADAVVRLSTIHFFVEDASPEEYLRIRNQKLKRDGYVYWDAPAIRFAMDFNRFYGGKTITLQPEIESNAVGEDEKKDVLMYTQEGDKLVIVETTLTDQGLKDFLPELFDITGGKCAEYQLKRGMVRLPASRSGDFNALRSGYFNLSLG